MSEPVANDAAPGSFDLEQARTALTSSSTTVRIAQLRAIDEKISHNSLDRPALLGLLKVLFWTHTFYADRPSRRAVQKCLTSITKCSEAESFVPPLVAAIRQEAQKQAIAQANSFALVEWCSLLIQNLAGTSLWEKCSKDLVLATADALEKSLQPTARGSVGHSALVITRRGFRKLVQADQAAVSTAIGVLAAKDAKPTAKNSVLLGVIAGVCARQPEAKAVVEDLKGQYFTFYAREIIGSRTALPSHIADGLHDFFAAFVSLEDLDKEVFPAIEKGLLRAPEVVLNDLITPLVKALPKLDLSKALNSRFVKPLLSNIKSSNAVIRSGAVRAFREIATVCRDFADLEKTADEVLGPLKTNKLASADHRVLHSEMLSGLPLSASIATKIATGLPAVTSKEANEAALSAETLALNASALFLLRTPEVPKALLDAYVKGLGDKKVSSRRIWILRTGDLLQAFAQEAELPAGFVAFAEAVVPSLLTIFNEVVANPTAAVQSGLVTGALVVAGLSGLLQRLENANIQALLKKAAVQKNSLILDPKPSFVLSQRLYSKYPEDDLKWFCRALSAIVEGLLSSSDAIKLAWTQAFIFLICSATTPSAVRRQAIDALSDLSARSLKPGCQFVATEIIKGLWHWIATSEAAEKESAAVLAKSGTSNLHLVLKAICLSPAELNRRSGGDVDKAQLQAQMCSLLVLAKQQLIPRASWIDLCLKVQVDPGQLAKDHEDALIDEIVRCTGHEQKSEATKQAAYSAAAELVFVSPENMTSRIVALIQDDLDAAVVSTVGPLEAAIFRTPEGTTFVDVLAKRQNVVPNKNVKDYDLLKWEEELRQQLAEKKGIQKKLTAEEQAKVSAQLKKEAEIRENVRKIAAKLLRGFGVVKALATGPPTDATRWMGAAVSSTLAAINAGATRITGETGPLAFVSLSEQITSRIGSFIRPFMGVATLRAYEVTALPENLTEEPFEELITRVLYRLRFVGEQRPLDTVSLIYVLPLVLYVLEKGGFAKDADEKDAQLVLAIEILSFHTDVAFDEALPRAEILSSLISSMQKYSQHYKILKDCFSDMVRCIAPNISPAEIGVLARGAIVPQTSVRTAVLQAISADVDMSDVNASEEIWLACHDDIDENAELGREIWEESEWKTSEELGHKMIPYLESKDVQLRRAAAKSLAEVAGQHPDVVAPILEKLRESYVELAKPRVQQLDEFGMPKKMDLSDPWEARHGIALAFKGLAPHLEKRQLEPYFNFLIEQGPLGDQSAGVRAEMLEAANMTIEIHGKEILDRLMKTFEKVLEAPDKNSEAADRVNEAVIIMYGALARHLKPGDKKIPVVIERLLATLSTPSEAVQYAIAECLPPLVRTCADKSSKYFDEMMEILLTSKKYSEQRGAAYGLAGLVLGRGINVLKEYRIMTQLNSALENKKEIRQRESAMIAYELLSTILGRLFEPYVIQIVPQLLAGFGDGNADVREAALAAAKACFAKLSSYGVKQILPTLLNGLDDDQWRSKKGACDLLGAMAYLDPQQLAQNLPEIIPPLTAVLNDSHKEVRAAANRSLKRFGEVITNPEIKSLIDILLKALSDPTKYTDDALDALIKVQFVHYLDAPSLALVSRILQRGLGDRSNTKRKASQVIGSLAHLTERKDLIAHLPVLVAGLKVAVVDPVPTTRATASRALGSLVEKLGEDALPDLIPNLMQTLKSDTSAGDRLGSAQALSEVLAGLGTSRLEETLPTILQNVESPKPAVREGFMSLFIFLPVCFGNSFANYLGKIIPPILSGLADDVESIRETALRAGRLLVKNFAVRAVDLLLPELERGLADDNYRIRLSSVELVGDLLFNLAGVKASANKEEDEADQDITKEAGASLREVLGEEKRNKILSALYVCRCDTAGAVRAAAVTVWKQLVHSPRTLKELVPTLTQLLIKRLGSSNMEHKVIASNALGELIKKAGDGVLATLLPTLEEGLQTSRDVNAKQGICLALKELISSASPEALEDHEKTLISVVRTALTDSDSDVREAAAEAFDSLQQIIGKRAIDQVLPFLLNLLRSEEEANNALAALLTLLTEPTRANIILPNLIPTLITPPISAFNAKALASLSKVAGAAMNRRLPNIINSLMDNIVGCADETLREELDTSFDTVILSIDDTDGLNVVMNVLLQLIKHEDHRKRAATGRHLAKFFSAATVNYSRYNQDIIRALLISFDDKDMEVVKASWNALNEFTKRLKKEEMEGLVISTRQTLLQVGVAGRELAGFELPKGINAILPIFLQGLMNGTAEQRVAAALGISDIVDRTTEASLKPFVTQITGPLIRVVSERSTEVRSAILLTLNHLLEKMPTALKPFLPQLQRTFAKSLADTSSEILRSRAARALGTLIKYTPRVDPLIAELVTGSKTTDAGVKTAMLKALYEVISKAGSNMGESSRAAVLGLIDMEPDENDKAMTITNAKLFGALMKNVPADMAVGLLKNRVMVREFTTSSVLALNAVLLESPSSLLDSPLAEDLPELLCQGIESKDAFIADNFIMATGKYLLHDSPKAFETTKAIFTSLAKLIPPGNPGDSRRLSLVLVRTMARKQPDMVRPHLSLLAPPIFSSVRDMVIPVKLAAEAAFVQLFAVADEESKVFDKWITAATDLAPNVKRSMQDYFKRVTLRLGAQARERREAEGGAGTLGLSADEVEDEKELMAVGKVDVGSDLFSE